jgi:hypothetical protein
VGAGVGGGIANLGGLVNVTNSTFTGNSAAYAGAIENYNGTLIVSASTLSANIATNNGGAIDNDAGATLLLNNSTFSGNSAGGGGGGINNHQAAATLGNCTLSANSAGGAGGINNYGTLALINARDRIYTFTYEATDDSANQARVSQDVVVPHDAKSRADQRLFVRYGCWISGLEEI